MWIDAISINQKNADEKNYQVPMMREIYSKATQTMAWLGEEQGDVELAFELLNQLAAAYRHLHGLSQTLSLDQDVGPVFPRIARFSRPKVLDRVSKSDLSTLLETALGSARSCAGQRY